MAVIANPGKSFAGGLDELRSALAHAGVPEPLWYELSENDSASTCARRAMADGADLLFVWGGDGTVQRCIDAVAGTSAVVAILPAGTGNLLAKNLGIPEDIAEAVEIGLHGDRRALDTGIANGEHFAVMAGAGMDVKMLQDAPEGLKDRFGRASYLLSGARNLAAKPMHATIEVDGRPFHSGQITCVLVGNVRDIFSGIEVFEESSPDDGVLEFGVVTARSRGQWVRTIGRVVLGHAQDSPFVVTARGTQMKVTFGTPTAYELDGSVCTATTELRINVRPKAITVCVPPPDPEGEASARDRGGLRPPRHRTPRCLMRARR